jgi:hypothetical protein
VRDESGGDGRPTDDALQQHVARTWIQIRVHWRGKRPQGNDCGEQNEDAYHVLLVNGSGASSFKDAPTRLPQGRLDHMKRDGRRRPVAGYRSSGAQSSGLKICTF